MIVNVRGTDWFYTVEGQGEPVLFLHGGLDSAVNFTRLTADLAASHQVIAVDRRGHGRTGDSAAPFDYALMADEVKAFAVALGLGRFHLVGYSDGANIGFHLASGSPELLRSFVAVSGNYMGLAGMAEHWLGMIPQMSAAYAREHMAKIVTQYEALNPRPDLESYVTKTKAIWNEEFTATEEQLQAIAVKTLLVAGDRDIVLPGQTVEMHRLIPGSLLMILPDTGHFIFQDFAYKTAAAVAVRVIKEFFAKQSASA